MRMFEYINSTDDRTFGETHFVFDDVSVPRRDNDKIIFPRAPLADIFPLKKRKQFLYHNQGTFFFGGTDERPFLVQLSQNIYYPFQKDSEEGFFAALKPESIRIAETYLNRKTRRQGDFFAVPMGMSWKNVIRAVEFGSGKRYSVVEIGRDSMLMDTRHRVEGKGINLPFNLFGKLFPLVFEGVLSAPDHEPLELKGPHLIDQAANLFDPKKAD